MNTLPSMLAPDALGWAAALLTLLTFVNADMRRLRLLALAANADFIAYAATAHLLPVMVLHLSLVPVNLWRLNQALQHHVHPASAPQASVPDTSRKPRGWTAARRCARLPRRQAGSAAPPETSACDAQPALARQAIDAPLSRSAR